MARKLKKVEVQKFGGTEDLGTTKMHDHEHEVKSVEATSDTNLELDTGYGNAVVIRCFEFGANPTVFKEHPPTKQELFNSHQNGIQMALWKDGLKVLSSVEPRIVIKEETYMIFVTAVPSRGNVLSELPKTLSQLAHG